MSISIGDAAKELGISIKTLRRWADDGKIRSERTPTGHRRFSLADIKRITPRDLKQLDDPSGSQLLYAGGPVHRTAHRITINYAPCFKPRPKRRFDTTSSSIGGFQH